LNQVEVYDVLDAARITRLLNERDEALRLARSGKTQPAALSRGSSGPIALNATPEGVVRAMLAGTPLSRQNITDRVLPASITAPELTSVTSSATQLDQELDQIGEAAMADVVITPAARLSSAADSKSSVSVRSPTNKGTAPPALSSRSFSTSSLSLGSTPRAAGEDRMLTSSSDATAQIPASLPPGIRVRVCEIGAPAGSFEDVLSDEVLCAPWVSVWVFDPLVAKLSVASQPKSQDQECIVS
jgi:hypothetical protein